MTERGVVDGRGELGFDRGRFLAGKYAPRLLVMSSSKERRRESRVDENGEIEAVPKTGVRGPFKDGWDDED